MSENLRFLSNVIPILNDVFFRDKFENTYHYHMYLVYLEFYMDGEDI